MKKNKLKRVLSRVLAAVMVAGIIAFTPQGMQEVKAATETTKNVNLGTVGIENPTTANTAWTGSKVYYAGKECYVLDKDGGLGGFSSDASEGGNMLLLTKDVLSSTQEFDDRKSDWLQSDIRSYLKGEGFLGTLSWVERNSLQQLKIDSNNTTHGAYSDPLSDAIYDAIFLLDLADIQNASYGFSSDSQRIAGDKAWWLRSAGYNNAEAAYVDDDGKICSGGCTVYFPLNVRPAFNLKLSAVLFSSASAAGKSSFESVADDKVSDNTWKLTLKDGNGSFAATRTDAGDLSAGTTVSVNVSSLGTVIQGVAYDTISGMLVDASGTVLCYGKARENYTGTGAYTFTIPANVTTGAKFYVFAEDIADAAATDYASNMVEPEYIAPSTYAVTVNNGTGDGNYTAGAAVTITADTAPSGQEFDAWTVVSGGVTLASATSTTTTFEMPANAVEVTATYKNVTPPAPGTYAVTVNNGTGDGNYTAGAAVTITADTAPSGQEFDAWTVVSGGVTLTSATSTTTTFEMPANAVEVTATYKNVTPPAPGTYAVTVNNGSGDGNYTAGAAVTITADTAPSGQEFDAWIVVSGGATLTSATSTTTTFPMPANAVEVTATYKNVTPPAPSTYAVTVNNGTGDGNYTAGAAVTITADTAPSGQEFDAWTVVSGGVTLTSATSTTTTFPMPANAVEVTATYKNKTTDQTPTDEAPADETSTDETSTDSTPSDPQPSVPVYTITAGLGETYELSTDGTLTITCDGALDKLTGIYVDDKLVDAANYTLQSGSTILTFNAAYLNTLSAGTHKMKFQYSDGSVETTFVIKEATIQNTTTENTAAQDTTTSSEMDEVPKTGDSTPVEWLFITAVISGAGIFCFGRKKKTVR